MIRHPQQNNRNRTSTIVETNTTSHSRDNVQVEIGTTNDSYFNRNMPATHNMPSAEPEATNVIFNGNGREEPFMEPLNLPEGQPSVPFQTPSNIPHTPSEPLNYTEGALILRQRQTRNDSFNATINSGRRLAEPQPPASVQTPAPQELPNTAAELQAQLENLRPDPAAHDAAINDLNNINHNLTETMNRGHLNLDFINGIVTHSWFLPTITTGTIFATLFLIGPRILRSFGTPNVLNTISHIAVRPLGEPLTTNRPVVNIIVQVLNQNVTVNDILTSTGAVTGLRYILRFLFGRRYHGRR